MARNYSAGLVMYRVSNSLIEVLLGHPGGPYFDGRDMGVWSIPKGRVESGEEAFDAAIREFHEETGIIVPDGAFLSLGEIRQRSGKLVVAWAFDCGAMALPPLQSHPFTMEWPPKSGQYQTFAEFDQMQFFPLPLARQKIIAAQVTLLNRLEEILAKAT